MISPKLGIVIPTLDEGETLGLLLADLAAQRGVEFSVVVADGGSEDNTRFIFERVAPSMPFQAEWVDAVRGRGAQMNAGARALEMPDLLFLHADTRLPEPDTLLKGAAAMAAARERAGTDRIAGHFGLSFASMDRRGFYYFFEAKTFTNRPGTVNGDQGLWLSRSFFTSLGAFSVTLPYMEDARIERRIRGLGGFAMLGGVVVTSARRFEAEGHVKRQVVNALMRAFEAVGETAYLADAARVYRTQSDAETLSLAPFLRAAHRATVGGGVARWFRLWYSVGGYVRGNAWQLPFMADCARERRRGTPPGEVRGKLTDALMPAFEAVTDNPVGKFLAALLTGATFYGLLAALLLREKERE